MARWDCFCFRPNCIFMLEAEMRPSCLHYCELPIWEMRCRRLEMLPGSSLGTQRHNQMLNRQEINSSFPFSVPHKKWVCFCWSFACVKAAVWSQCLLSHLTFGMSESSLWWGPQAFSGGGSWAQRGPGGANQPHLKTLENKLFTDETTVGHWFSTT